MLARSSPERIAELAISPAAWRAAAPRTSGLPTPLAMTWIALAPDVGRNCRAPRSRSPAR
jgi:hypothetical protein